MRMPIAPWYRCAARQVAASLGFWAGVSGGPGAAEEPATKLVLAYDRPLPEAARRALAEVQVVDVETKAPLAGSELLVMNFVDLLFHPVRTGPTGRARFAGRCDTDRPGHS